MIKITSIYYSNIIMINIQIHSVSGRNFVYILSGFRFIYFLLLRVIIELHINSFQFEFWVFSILLCNFISYILNITDCIVQMF